GSGTASSTTFLRGDGTWAAAGSSLTNGTAANQVYITGSSPWAPTNPVSISGDASLAGDGTLTLANGVITNAKVSASAAIALSKLASGTGFSGGQTIVTNASNVPTYVTPSGDVVFNNTGATQIFISANTGSHIVSALNAIQGTTLNTGIVNPGNLGTGTASSSTFLRGDGSWQTPSSSLPNGTAAGQILITGATPFTPAYNAVSGDASLANDGTLTIANGTIT